MHTDLRHLPFNMIFKQMKTTCYHSFFDLLKFSVLAVEEDKRREDGGGGQEEPQQQAQQGAGRQRPVGQAPVVAAVQGDHADRHGPSKIGGQQTGPIEAAIVGQPCCLLWV